jgi:hypothetical protein
MIIGICGFINSGKDTLANYLISQHNYSKLSFASTLKDAVSLVFGWDRELLEGSTKFSRAWREQSDTWWAERLNMPHLTPRWVLQYWGTEVCRQGFHDDIWIACLENKLRNTEKNIVITDCRFPNEVDMIHRQGGKIVWVQRGPLPEWYDTALTQNTTDLDMQWILDDNGESMEKKYPKVHPSEWAWVGSNFDYIIENNQDIETLNQKVKDIITSLG